MLPIFLVYKVEGADGEVEVDYHNLVVKVPPEVLAVGILRLAANTF